MNNFPWSILHIFTISSFPICLQDYFHRVGRTARAGRSGLAISLVNQFDIGPFTQIEKHIGGQAQTSCFLLGATRSIFEKKKVLTRRLNSLLCFQMISRYPSIRLMKMKSCYWQSVLQKPKGFPERYSLNISIITDKTKCSEILILFLLQSHACFLIDVPVVC